MTLIRTSVLNGIAVIVRILSSLLINKVLALYVGPAGYAVIGQFQNVIAIISSIAGGVLAPGVTKETAQHAGDTVKQHAVWKTAVSYSLGASTLVAIFLIFCSNSLNAWLLHQVEFNNLFVWFALSVPAITLNNLLLAVINGKKAIGVYVSANILGSLLGLIVTAALVSTQGLYGALVALVVSPAVVLFVTVCTVYRCNWFSPLFFWGRANKTAAKSLAAFGLMGLVSALSAPMVFILVREYITANFGLIEAGYWQAVYKISDTYLMLVVSTLTVYYLPRLAEIKVANELRSEIIRVYKVVLPCVVIGAGLIFLWRDFIVRTLFSSDFLAICDLMGWQLVGDVLKIGSWVLSFVLAGRAMVKPFIITEVVFNLSYLLLVVLCTSQWGVKGVMIAYAINYGLYWMCMCYLINGELHKMRIID